MWTGPLPLEPASAARCLILLLAGVACAAPAPPVIETVLRPTADTVVAPFGDIAGAAWLADRRWVVVAPQDRVVSLADFARHGLSRFGVAAELSQPYYLFRSGDSILVNDWLRRRLTAWSLEGTLRGAVPAVSGLRGALPRARDAAGHWYFELPPPAGPDGRGNLDSTAIARTDASFGTVDTVGRLAPFDLVEVLSEGRRRLERRLLSGQDRWGVLPDGTLWIARIVDNRVDWRAPDGRRIRGTSLPDRVLPITQNDRDIFLSRFEPALRPTVEQTPFAVIKPPFEDAVTAPDGAVWLTKNRAVGDSIREYQIIDREGRMVGTARHPGLGKLLALGGGYALVGEPFAGGVRLLLFQLVAPPGA
jgi:hypothetical protein